MNLFKEFGSGFNNFVDGVGNFFGGIGNTLKGAFDSIVDKGASGIWDDYTGNTANRENIEYQKDYNQEVWNRADTQYQRTVADLRAAGLSSQLAAGSPSTVAGQSAAPQRTVGNESQAIERLVGMIISMKQTEASVNLTNAQADKARAETSMVNKELGTYGERTAVEIALGRSQANLNNAYARLSQIDGETRAAKNVADLEYVLSNTRHNNALVKLVEKQVDGVRSQIALNNSQIGLNRSNVDLNRSRISLNGSQIDLNRSAENYNYALTAYKQNEGRYLNKQIDLLSEQIISERFRQGYIDAETKYVERQFLNAYFDYVVDYATFKFNVDHGDSPTATQVSSSQRAEAKRQFLRSLTLEAVGTVSSVLSGVAGGLGAGMALGFGRGAGSMFFDKMRGMDEHPSMGFHP